MYGRMYQSTTSAGFIEADKSRYKSEPLEQYQQMEEIESLPLDVITSKPSLKTS